MTFSLLSIRNISNFTSEMLSGGGKYNLVSELSARTENLSTAEKLEMRWQEATLANNFIFYKVMRHHPDSLKHLIELLLNIEIEKLEFSNEETIDIDVGAKGIRLDIYAKDSERVFDVEIQTTDTKELPDRARFYQSAMDIDTLKTGQKYADLKESHVIFICFEDIFGNALPISTFSNICHEDGKTSLGDRTFKHFFNAKECAKMDSLSKEQRAFFDFLCYNKVSSDFATQLNTYVADAKHNTQWRMQFMTWEMQRLYDFDAGKEQGKEEGISIGIIEGSRQKAEETARKLLAKNYPIADIAECTGLSIEEVENLSPNKQ